MEMGYAFWQGGGGLLEDSFNRRGAECAEERRESLCNCTFSVAGNGPERKRMNRTFLLNAIAGTDRRPVAPAFPRLRYNRLEHFAPG